MKNQNKNNNNRKPDVNPVPKQQITEEKIKQGKVGGVKPKGGGRQGAVSREDGGFDTGSSAGSH